jgi:hypothetical protein
MSSSNASLPVVTETPDSPELCPRCSGPTAARLFVEEGGRRVLCPSAFHRGAVGGERLIHLPNQSPLTHEQATAEHAAGDVFAFGGS